MAKYVKSIHVDKLFGNITFTMNFQPGVNIVLGSNGSGKTTLIHILANALEGNFLAFQYLNFEKIKIILDDNYELWIIKENDEIIVMEANKGKENVVFSSEKLHFNIPISKLSSSEKNRYMQLQYLDERLENLKSQEDGDLEEIQLLSRRRNHLSHFFLEKYNMFPDDDYPFSPILQISYFPAFRAMIEAWASIEDREYYGESRRDRPHNPSFFAKKWFGPFTPNVTFKSIQMISSELRDQIREAQREIWRIENDSINRAFSEIIKSVSAPKESGRDVDLLLDQILKLSDDYSSLPFRGQSGVSTTILKQIQDLNKQNLEEGTARAVVKIYFDYLSRIYKARVAEFKHIQRYLDAVNKFLLPKKKIVVDEETGFGKNSIGVKFEKSEQTRDLRTLSSGERQILTMVYSATDMSDEDLVLIDEPEISLHVDWQRVLLSRMSKLMGKDKQIIATTHSPTIAADYLDQLINLDELIDRSKGK